MVTRRRRLAAAIAVVATLAVAPSADAATATTPTLVPNPPYSLYFYNVASTVTTDGPATVTMVTTAYRHAPATRARLTVAEATTLTITAPCRPTRLPTTWTVYVDGVKVGYAATLRCE